MSSDVIELLVLFALAAVVLYRLRAVIGTRTGHEAPPEFVRRQQDARRSGAKPRRMPEIASAPEEDEPLPGYLRFYVDDPFGNRLELMEPAVSGSGQPASTRFS